MGEQENKYVPSQDHLHTTREGWNHRWFLRFMQRQPQLSFQKGDPTANVRMECLTEEVHSDYFALLKEEMTKGNFMNPPNRIYNFDDLATGTHTSNNSNLIFVS